jgi:aspartyl-tRNA(Asn)/glutamyl-tRNA(Gln) amidotransferase subunit B
MGDVSRRLNLDEKDISQAPVPPEVLATLLQRIADGTVSHNAARQVMDALWGGEGVDVDAVIDAKGLRQMNDASALEALIDDVVAANPDNVSQYKAGKDKAFNALVGQVMKKSQGKANPAHVNELLKRKLG